MAEINLNQIFNEAFGYNPPAKMPAIEQAAARAEHSKLGQKMYGEDLFGREFFMPCYIDGTIVPFAVIGCTWKKTYVSTGMPERGGTVKELISIDDYAISIKGIFISPDNEWPEYDIIKMHKLFKQNKSVPLRSALTDIFLSGKSDGNSDDPVGHRVVIKEISWPEVSGIEHAKPFSMTVESDLIFELEIK